jgi:hypothetical protein
MHPTLRRARLLSNKVEVKSTPETFVEDDDNIPQRIESPNDEEKEGVTEKEQP